MENKKMTEWPPLAAPRISVVICNYNYAPFVAEAIESALNQSHAPWEVIVVDDGSTDDSREIIERHQGRIRAIFQENSGQRSAYNAGMSALSGDVVIFLDSDDALEPDALAVISTEFEEGVSKVHFRMRLVDGSGTSLGGTIPRHLDQGDLSARILTKRTFYNSAPASGNAYRVSALRPLFPIPICDEDKLGADFFVILAAALRGRVKTVDRVLARYRVHAPESAASQTLTFGNAAKANDEHRRFGVRCEQASIWLAERSGGQLLVPRMLIDFSVEKGAYARSALGSATYLGRIASGVQRFPVLLRSIALREDFGLLRKGLLVAWAAFVLLAPRGAALRAARYVCNPAAR